jgi:hypothetical protein
MEILSCVERREEIVIAIVYAPSAVEPPSETAFAFLLPLLA